MTEPVLDEHGEVLYVISGAINLSEQNLLGELANVKFGKSGYMFITNTEGVVIDDPDKSRILQRADAKAGRNPATELAMAGFEGAIEAKDRTGLQGSMLSSASARPTGCWAASTRETRPLPRSSRSNATHGPAPCS